jgi:sialic acid synthase SpsE
MKIESHDLDRRVFIVAEIGNNHEGNSAVAEALIEKAAAAGVNAVKFQTCDPANFVSFRDAERLERMQRFRLSDEQLVRLAAVAKAHGIVFFSTPLDLGSVALLEPIVPVFKVASGDNSFYPLLERIADTGKPIILSTGLVTLNELKKSIQVIQARWALRKIDPDLALVHCVSSYPAPPEEANVAAIRELAQCGFTVGYSDHTVGIDAAVLAVAVGARIVEKHFTLDKHYSSFRDHQLSADPQDMEELVKQIRYAEVLLGSGRKIPQPSELANLNATRRSIVAAHELVKGAVLARSDITWIRPAGGLPPGSESLILDRRLRTDVPAGTPLTADLFE